MSDEKTEQPTQRKLQQSREMGQVAQRKNVVEAATLVVGCLYVFATIPLFSKGLVDVLDLGLQDLDKSLYERRTDIQERFIASLTNGLVLTALLGIFCLIFHLIVNGFNFAPKSMSPKFEKFNPINGLKGIFSKATAYSFIRLLIYFSATTAIFFVVVKENMAQVIQASICGVSCVGDVFIYLFVLTTSLILLVLLLLAAFDFRIQDAIFKSQSKMTKDEVKREHKGSEGDPLIKSARRRLALSDANLPSLREITHAVYSSAYLVGVVYYGGRPPYIVIRAKGDSVTRQVSRLRSARVKCINLPEVAREFYNLGQVGSYLPPKTIKSMEKLLSQ